jgi:cellulose synthase/poly-beta-1,6-N-acetylglucosamine synthase-like glycosyltransferase
MHSISIIIPVKAINEFIRESLSYIQQLDYQDFEVLIFPDEDKGESFPHTRVISTGSIGPAEKRDLALKYARGDILAFLDDDAYPKSDWLRNALVHFDNPEVAAVGGPAVTSSNDNIRQQASGEAYASWLVSGQYNYRYRPGRLREVDDYPSVNLLVRKDIFARVGGFNSNYYPGEDTKLCWDIIDLGYKIIYDPTVLVWHHRRPVFRPHLGQVAGYAVHRGNFARALATNSFKLVYFVPSLFVLFVIFFPVLGYFFKWVYPLYLGVLTIYLLLVIVSVIRIKHFSVALLTASTIIATNFTYGIYFLKGLLTKKLIR